MDSKDIILLNLDLQKKDIGFRQSSKWKFVYISKMHHIAKNWECVFDFQYEVTIGECDAYHILSFISWDAYADDYYIRSHLLTILKDKIQYFSMKDRFLLISESWLVESKFLEWVLG